MSCNHRIHAVCDMGAVRVSRSVALTLLQGRDTQSCYRNTSLSQPSGGIPGSCPTSDGEEQIKLAILSRSSRAMY